MKQLARIKLPEIKEEDILFSGMNFSDIKNPMLLGDCFQHVIENSGGEWPKISQMDNVNILIKWSEDNFIIFNIQMFENALSLWLAPNFKILIYKEDG